MVAATATLGGEDPPALGALAGFDLTLGEDALAFPFEPDGDGCRHRGVTERRRGKAWRGELLATIPVPEAIPYLLVD